MMRAAVLAVAVVMLLGTAAAADDVQITATAQGAPGGLNEFLDGIAILTYPQMDGFPKPMQLLSGTLPEKNGSFTFPEPEDPLSHGRYDKASPLMGEWLDKTSVALLQSVASGATFPRLSLKIEAPGGQAVTLNFEQIKVTYMGVYAPGFGDRSLPSTQEIPNNKPLVLLKIMPKRATWKVDN